MEEGFSGNNPSSSSTKISHKPEVVPLATLARIMNIILPEDVKIADGTKKRGKECVVEFIYYATNQAIKKHGGACYVTLTTQDVNDAMRTLGLDNYIEPLTIRIIA
ncbi:unnamed protein product [Fraxinus pennsylvanica]|uniref:Transcription factor CBF/NF-Y/archaeal histone domain-containing protein n=1 Tax=Fraxinus pennsylvanica TaxID=56036 RepID=A0AAD2ABQ0_9LAMI|nr:unnamed protein product [Fraxinus pennsylvanica]